MMIVSGREEQTPSSDKKRVKLRHRQLTSMDKPLKYVVLYLKIH